MELLKKYPKFFQWFFLLIVFFSLCFAIDVPETYNFIRGQLNLLKILIKVLIHCLVQR